MALHRFLTFANDAQLAGLWGAVALALGLVAIVAERWRLKRARIDRVGWMPWTGIFLVCAVVGVSLLALAAKGLLGG